MLSSSLRASLVALVASAVAVSAAPAIFLDVNLAVVLQLLGLKGDGPENMKVVTTVANTGKKPVKLLKDPRGVLSSFPENSFSITGPAGSQPPFNGARVKYSPKYAAGLDDPNAYTVLAPGDTIDVTHDLAKAYDFTKSGTGEYSVKPSNRFTIVNDDGTLQDFYATIGDTPKVKLSGHLPAARLHNKGATPDSCSADQESQLVTAAGDAQSYAKNALSYISGVSSDTPRYTTWFGTYDSTRRDTVEGHFKAIGGNDFSTYTYDCTCTDAGVYAYVYPDEFGTIYLCGAFWTAPATGTDSKAGTIVHEASLFTDNGGTKDLASGQDNCKALAQSDPASAILNADSHEYFAENTPEQE